MQCLSNLSKRGRKFSDSLLDISYHYLGTIVFSIHQPRYSIFKLFDNVLLLCKGRTVYHGRPNRVLSYFTKQGYQCDEHDNPADFVLDVLIDASHNADDLDALYRTYKDSAMHKKVISYFNDEIQNHHDRIESDDQAIDSTRPLGREMYYISKRTLQNTIRNPSLLLSQVLVAVILGLLVGSVFHNMPENVGPGISNRLGAIFFIVVSQIFSTVTALESLLNERALFIHVRPSLDLACLLKRS